MTESGLLMYFADLDELLITLAPKPTVLPEIVFIGKMILEKNVFFQFRKLINFPKIYKNALVKEKITVNRDAITGNKLYHNCEVVIFESIGRKLVLFLILICNQKIDNG